MFRDKLVQFLYTVNVFVLGATGLGLLFMTDTMVPGVNAASTAAVRNQGTFALVYSILISTLGPKHHGGYCLTMTLHFVLAMVCSLQAKETKTPKGSYDPVILVQAGFSYAMFVVMLTILMNGGIGEHNKQEGKPQKAQ